MARAKGKRKAIIDLNKSPQLVVEVISPSTRRTDYRSKHAEYMVLGIAEYWIVDPEKAKVIVLALVDDWYEATEFSGDDFVLSPLFPELKVRAAKILEGS